jgi:hypothetical protein
VIGLGQAGQVDHHLLAQGADEEMVLVVAADLPLVGESVDVDLLVQRLPIG